MRRLFCSLPALFVLIFSISAQNPSKKYNSLLWEISGNGLKKPSYLFGTMHVSNKLAFHLSDSFYYAIRSADQVAIELNPETWQPELARQIMMGKEWAAYRKNYADNYINQYSFRIDKYEERLKKALSAEPASINMLLYRTYETAQDFEEDTFLDMYIYQTGRKLGKQATGVENFWEMERLVAEAYEDMKKDKKQKKISFSDDAYDATRKMQEAYKKGDLDQLDSLNKKMQPSDIFLEKFLYRRNINQANAIDSIIRSKVLFVGVGSAHLPGQRGVIELLRSKGYTLRPVFMKNRDAEQKDAIEKMKVPVIFQANIAEDGFYKVNVPGKLYMYPNVMTPGILQYADMANGVYYTVNRLSTHAAVIGQDEATVLKKVDSLLYENIPGKIISRNNISRNGYKGFDIVNKTRRGDIQRYQIFVAPFSIIIFKISGTGDYVSNNKDADAFFNSIEFRNTENNGTEYFSPASGGFRVQFPSSPVQTKEEYSIDQMDTWFFESYDRKANKACMVMKKAVHQFDFMEEDSFDISLADESFRSGDFFDKNISSRYTSYKGYPCLDVTHQLKDSSVIYGRYIFKGPFYYLLLQKGGNETAAMNFFSSFTFIPYQYGVYKNFTDSVYKFSVYTPVYREVNDTIRKLAEVDYSGFSAYRDDEIYKHMNYSSAILSSRESGELAGMGVQAYNCYYYAKDTARFWKDETGETYRSQKFVLLKKESFQRGDSIRGYYYTYTDTGSSKIIQRMAFLYRNRMYRVSFIMDSIERNNEFSNSVFRSLSPSGVTDTISVFNSKSPIFFSDLYSQDTARRKKALNAVLQVDFQKQDIPMLINAVKSFKVGDKDYLVNKSSFIKAIAYMEDSTASNEKLKALQQLYKDAGDTSGIQNEVLMAMAGMKTKESFAALKQILVQDPPVFDNEYDLDDMFRNFSDTPKLSKNLFPELLQLVSIDEYKSSVVSLLAELCDSGYLKTTDYENYYSKLVFDMKFLMKKLKSADEKLAGNEMKKKNDEDDDDNVTTDDLSVDADTRISLYNFSVLLMPYYEKNELVRTIFSNLLQTRDDKVRLQTSLILLRNNKPVADSIIYKFASKDEFRRDLYEELESIKKLSLFPAAFRTQELMARSIIFNEINEAPDSLLFLSKQEVRFFRDHGVVYFFKYKKKKQDDWFLALCGLQPLQKDIVNISKDYLSVYNAKITGAEPLDKLMQKELKKKMFAGRRSSRDFFDASDIYDVFRR